MDYRSDIDNLIQSIDEKIWTDKTINGIQYDIYPWHGNSSISIKTRSDDEQDVASWKYFDCASSDQINSSIQFKNYQESYDKLYYHFMLIEAAKCLLETDLSKLGISTLLSDIGLNKLFQPRVFDPDETFTFNYCEIIVAGNIKNA